MMSAIRLIMWIWVAFLCYASEAAADTSVCTSEEARRAEAIVVVANSWRQVHEQFERYAHCDDGAIAEGFSESITLLLAEHWDTIRQLQPFVVSDPVFRKFILRHIDETVPAERLQRIAKYADNRCPRNLKALCRDMRAAATQ